MSKTRLEINNALKRQMRAVRDSFLTIEVKIICKKIQPANEIIKNKASLIKDLQLSFIFPPIQL